VEEASLISIHGALTSRGKMVCFGPSPSRAARARHAVLSAALITMHCQSHRMNNPPLSHILNQMTVRPCLGLPADGVQSSSARIDGCPTNPLQKPALSTAKLYCVARKNSHSCSSSQHAVGNAAGCVRQQERQRLLECYEQSLGRQWFTQAAAA
jgi:hypothetical protein